MGFDQSRTDGYMSGKVIDSELRADRTTYREASVQDRRSTQQSLWLNYNRTLSDYIDFSVDLSRRLSNQRFLHQRGQYSRSTANDEYAER